MSPGRHRGAARLALTLVSVVCALFVAAAPAVAHSELERSDPPNGGMVAVGRTVLTAWFAQPISTDASTYDLRTEDGERLPVSARNTASGGGRVVTLDTGPLGKGTYVLSWRVLSLDDGHPSSGSIVFGAGVRPAVVPSGSGGLPDAPGFLLRSLDLTALLLAFGALAVSGRVLGSMGEVGRRPRDRARRIGAFATAAVVVTGALTPFVRTPRGGSLGAWTREIWATLTGTPWGHLWLVREVALAVAMGALWPWLSRRSAPPARVRLAAAALVAATVLESWAGHASSLPSRTAPAVLASATHVVAAGAWAGGLAVLALCVLPVTRREPDLRGPVLASVWRTFSPRAAVASVVVLATGLYEAGRHVPDLDSVTSTVYGGAVAGKTLLVVLALALAGVNTLVVNPRLASRVGRLLGRPDGWAPVSLRRFGTVVLVEMVVLLVAAGAAAVLTSVPTAREVTSATTATAPQVDSVDGLFITVESLPAGPEHGRLVVHVQATVLPEPAPVRGVHVLLAGPGKASASLDLDAVEPGQYEAETPVATPGRWKAWVAVQREGLPDVVSQVRWKVAPSASGAAGPLEVVTTSLALLLLTGLSAAVWLVARRRAEPEPLGEVVLVRERSAR